MYWILTFISVSDIIIEYLVYTSNLPDFAIFFKHEGIENHGKSCQHHVIFKIFK